LQLADNSPATGMTPVFARAVESEKKFLLESLKGGCAAALRYRTV